MVYKCIYCGAQRKSENGRTFHAFPLSNPENLLAWINACGLKAEQINKWSRLCSDHFKQSCIVQGRGVRRIAEGAVPTIFGNRSAICVYCGRERNRAMKRSVHKFPLTKKRVLQKWVLSVPKLDIVPTSDTMLCSEHFEDRCFFKSGCLKPTAVPSIFLPLDNTEINPLKCERTEHNIVEEPVAEIVSSPISPEHDKKNVSSDHIVRHDHCYEDTLRITKEKLLATRRQLFELRMKFKNYKRKMKRIVGTIYPEKIMSCSD